MKESSSHQKASQRKPSESKQSASAGPQGVSFAPPAYGIDSVDNAPAQVAPDNETGLHTAQAHHDPSRSAAFQALAYPQGMGIHIAPHEAWSVVQRKQAAVGAVATTSASTASAVVQRWEWPWNWGKKKKPDPEEGLSESDRQAARVLNAIAQDEHAHRRRQNALGGPSYDYASVDDIRDSRQAYTALGERSQAVLQPPLIRSRAQKAQAATSGISALGTFGTHVGQVIGNDTLGTSGRLTSGIGGGLGAVGSLFEAGLETHDIIKSDEKKKDKAIRSVGVLGTLSNAVNSGASSVGQVSGIVSGAGTLSSLASTVAAPAAIAKGGVDVITGLATGGLAHYRSNRLQEIEARDTQTPSTQKGIARFAKESQWNKAKSNYGKATGGALSVAGGALLLAAGLSNPIGWGLLAGAGLIGLGLAAYRMYKKHQQGKKLATDVNYQQALSENHINVPTDEELGPGKWGDIFKTKSMRRQEVVRGLIATRLAEHEHENSGLREVGSHLGISRLPGENIGLLPHDAQKIKRAKGYAKALDY